MEGSAVLFASEILARTKSTDLTVAMPKTRQTNAFKQVTSRHGIPRAPHWVGRWGNGDVEVALDSVENLPYVIGLVRQSFERQMGSPSDT